MSIKSSPPPLLSPRSALILALAVLIGLGIGLLTALAHHAPAEVVLAGCTATGAATVALHKLIGF
jgi:hypothetical protein